MKGSCKDCRLAKWHTTKIGTLHPSGQGRCTWQEPVLVIPKSRYWHGGEPHPSGGSIERKTPYTDCPTWEEKRP